MLSTDIFEKLGDVAAYSI